MHMFKNSIPANDAFSKGSASVLQVRHNGHLPADDTLPTNGQLKRIGKVDLSEALVFVDGRPELDGV